MPIVDIWEVPSYPLILGTPAALWPSPDIYVQVPAILPGVYVGAYSNRQQRFSLRSLRRSGIYVGDLSVMELWGEDGGNGCWVE
jgi:hypothetical protein